MTLTPYINIVKLVIALYNSTIADPLRRTV